MKILKTIIKVLLALACVAGIAYLCYYYYDPTKESMYYMTIVSLAPPVVAILLALITKEVYSSLFIGIVFGALLYANFQPLQALLHMIGDGVGYEVVDGEAVNLGQGMIGISLFDQWNLGILVFLVILGIMVVIMNKAGGSAAFGRWAQKHIKTKVGAAVATIILGMLIFIDDYFNCLTVGSVMTPVAERKGISKEKLAYLIDATAAPVCIIAPISSWAAAVSGFTPEGTNGLVLFIRAIPYNLYAILTIVMMFTITFMKFDYGPMKKAELKAAKTSQKKLEIMAEKAEKIHEKDGVSPKGSVLHLVLPVLLLIICCVAGMIYTGGFFEGNTYSWDKFVNAFADSDASTGLVYGSLIALIITMFFFIITRVVSFRSCMEAIPEGFKNMVPAILILVFAWTLKAMTDSLGAAEYVASLVQQIADNSALMALLPCVIFLISFGLAFATGTSWGTFGILIPIVIYAFSGTGATTVDLNNELMIICVSASMAGAVCGDHCSPISDTTIMASAGSGCVHVDHVSTQLPYALTVAAVSFVGYILAGFVKMWYVVLPVSIALMIGVLFLIKFIDDKISAKKEQKD